MTIRWVSAVVLLLLSSTTVRADFYSCEFTEPFFSVLVSTKYKIATVAQFERRESETVKIKSFKKNDGHYSLELENGATLTIDRDIVGSDGMSDFYHPHEAKYNSYFGACSSTTSANINVDEVDRFKSYSKPNGLALVRYWPGEMAALSGYKVRKNVTLAADQTWNSLILNQRSERACTLKKGAKYMPVNAAKGDIYAFLTAPEKLKANYDSEENGIKKGDVLTVIAYAGEGYCTLEKSGRTFVDSCPVVNRDDEATTEEDAGLITSASERDALAYEEEFTQFDAPEGYWLFTTCAEGHRVWVNEQTLFNPDLFEAIQLDP